MAKGLMNFLRTRLPLDREFTARAKRYAFDFSVMVSGPTISPFTSRVSNISRSGMLLENAGALQVGDVVTVSLPDQRPTLCSVVRLSRSGGAGIKFTSLTGANDR
jgi:hypothetical protein